MKKILRKKEKKRKDSGLKKQNLLCCFDEGFSLIELIIVIVIMAILIGIVASQVIPYMEKSKKAKDKQKLSTIHTGFVEQLAEKGSEEIAEELFGSTKGADCQKFYKKTNVSGGVGEGIVFMKIKDNYPANATGSTNGWDEDGFYGFALSGCGLDVDKIAKSTSYDTSYELPFKSRAIVKSGEVDLHVYLDCDFGYSPVFYLTWKNAANAPADPSYFFFD